MKKRIDNRQALFYHERDIWWCALGVNVGDEMDGSGEEFRRPVLVLRGISREVCLVVPLTSSPATHPLRPSIGNVDGKEAKAIISQIRVVDSKRFVRKVGYLDRSRFQEIKKIARGFL